MDYPSQQTKLIMPEYGRNVQRMIDHALTIQDREERNCCAEAIVRTMMQLHPELNNDEKRHTFYDHLALMSGFRLDIDYPYGEPLPEELDMIPKPLLYSNPAFPYRHYGKVIQAMINEAKREEDLERREALIIRIANRLKYTYLVWNKDEVADEQIMMDVERLSGGLLHCNFPAFALLDAEQLLPKEAVQSKKKKKK